MAGTARTLRHRSSGGEKFKKERAIGDPSSKDAVCRPLSGTQVAPPTSTSEVSILRQIEFTALSAQPKSVLPLFSKNS